ncbi:MAG: hypothetical protein HYZ79_02520 [Candidatus Melainabacteria bacterium]|nr:hypothetical protein [Candidatus Melainabacteria bacterium]
MTIDQLDLLNIGHITYLKSLLTIVIFSILAFSFKKHSLLITYGMVMYFVCLLPFLQIIPLYSLVAERYNYFSSAFLILVIVYLLRSYLKNKIIFLISILLLVSFAAGTRSLFRIYDWENSQTLFLSTINSSKSLFKKGIWTYNLALCQDSEETEKELLLLADNLLKVFIQNTAQDTGSQKLQYYGLDNNSLILKAYLRSAKINSLLGNKTEEYKILKKVLELSMSNPTLQSEIYKSLATFHFEGGDFKQALALYKKSHKLISDPALNYAIAVCHLKLGDLGNYEHYLKKATSEISLKNTKPFKTYGQFLELNKSDFKEAERMYKIATLLEDDPIPYTLLATLQLKQNKINEAFKTVKRGLHSFPKNPNLIYLNGAILINKGGKEAGKADLERVLRDSTAENNLRVEAGNILVNILLSENNVEKVKEYNKLILEIDPNNTEALSRHLL